METIIAYDISGKHLEFKNEMKKLGYQDKITEAGNCKVLYLPNTTLYHPTKSPVEARTDALNIKNSLKIQLERCIATIWDKWAAICGESF